MAESEGGKRYRHLDPIFRLGQGRTEFREYSKFKPMYPNTSEGLNELYRSQILLMGYL